MQKDFDTEFDIDTKNFPSILVSIMNHPELKSLYMENLIENMKSLGLDIHDTTHYLDLSDCSETVLEELLARTLNLRTSIATYKENAEALALLKENRRKCYADKKAYEASVANNISKTETGKALYTEKVIMTAGHDSIYAKIGEQINILMSYSKLLTSYFFSLKDHGEIISDHLTNRRIKSGH